MKTAAQKALELSNKFGDLAELVIREIIENNYNVLGSNSYHTELLYWGEVKEELAKLRTS